MGINMNSTAFFIITLLFGWCGAHKFIQKKYGLGLLYLFTFGLFTFGWAVDCIRALLPVLRHKNGAPAAGAQHDNIVDQLCLSLDPEFFHSFCPWLKQGFPGKELSRLTALPFLILNATIFLSGSSMLKVITQILLRSQAWKSVGLQNIGSFQCQMENCLIFARELKAALFRYPLQGSATTARPSTLAAGVLPL